MPKKLKQSGSIDSVETPSCSGVKPDSSLKPKQLSFCHSQNENGTLEREKLEMQNDLQLINTQIDSANSRN